jgi:hypothetical protein
LSSVARTSISSPCVLEQCWFRFTGYITGYIRSATRTDSRTPLMAGDTRAIAMDSGDVLSTTLTRS